MEMLRNCFHSMPGQLPHHVPHHRSPQRILTIPVLSQKPTIAPLIPFITKYHLSPITPGNDVIEGPYKMNARLSCHTDLIPMAQSDANTYLFMPDPFRRNCIRRSPRWAETIEL
jgi:hypothetical protein